MTTALAMRTWPTHPSSGGRLVATDGRELPLLGTRLAADARGGLARVVLEQRFANRHAEPLAVTYLFPLPHDGAVSGFAFRLGKRRVVGEVDRVAAARERFEAAVLDGRTAGLLEQERGSVFTQSVGNVPPGEEVVVEIQIDQRLAWAGGSWEWRFPTALAPRYLGAEGRVPDAGRVAVEVAEGGIAPLLALSLLVRDAVSPGGAPESPSHAIRLAPAEGGVRVSLAAEEGAPLDRDAVVRWPVATPEVGLSLDACRPATARLDGARAFGLLTVVPPRDERAPEAMARDLVVLIDTSGSMHGRPLEQAKETVSELVRELGNRDSLELVSFSNAPVRWRKEPVTADDEAKRDALRWLAGLAASGGTEMRDGVLEALRPLREDAQRQVVLVTDGLIGFEKEVVSTVLARLPAGSRLHAVGVGDSVNRSLTSPLARAGRGLEVVIGLGEDAASAARALVARTSLPLVTGLTVEGPGLAGEPPTLLPDLFGGAPVLVPVELRPSGGEIVLRGVGTAGPFERRVALPAVEAGAGSPAAAALFARESVEALEMRLAAGEPRKAIDVRIERLGLDFQIATRLTAWVAVSEEPTVDPKTPIRRERMPQALAHGLSVEGLGLRGRAPMQPLAVSAMPPPGEPGIWKLYEMDLPPRALDEDALVPTGRRPPARAMPPVAKATTAGRTPAGTYAWRGGRLVVTVEAESSEIDWQVPAEVELIDAAGKSHRCAVDAARTTRAGTVAAGASIRIVLAWPGSERPALTRLVARVGSRALAIDLTEA